MKVIHTKTQEQFNKVLEIFEKKGRVTSNGRDPLYYTPDYNDLIEYSDYFGFYSKKTDYSLFDNIISFEEFLRLEGIEPTEEYTRGEEIQYKGNLTNWISGRVYFDKYEDKFLITTKEEYESLNDGDEDSITLFIEKQIRKLPKEETKVEITKEELENLHIKIPQNYIVSRNEFDLIKQTVTKIIDKLNSLDSNK